MNLLQNAELMKRQTIGVEIEFSGISQLVAIRTVARHFGTENTIERCRYDHDGTTLRGYKCIGKNAEGVEKEWLVVGDGSLSSSTTSSRNEGGCGELVTPVLKYDDIPTLQEILRELRAEGAKSSNYYGCGVHIHIGADIGKEGGHTVKSLVHLAKLMKSHEQILINAVNVSRDRYSGGYCSVTDDRFIKALEDKRPQTIDELKTIWYTSQGYSEPRYASGNHYHSSRYHMLNYHSVFLKLLAGEPQKATVEFRLFEFHKSMHAGELKAYIQLCLAMSSYAKLITRSSARPIDMTNEKYAMISWLKNMGLVGGEFKTARKMLTKRLTGDCAYRTPRTSSTGGLDDLDIAD